MTNMKLTQAAVAIVNKQIDIQGSCSEVINTASTIRNITHYNTSAFGVTKNKQQQLIQLLLLLLLLLIIIIILITVIIIITSQAER